MAADHQQLVELLRPMGLQEKRASMLVRWAPPRPQGPRFSREYLGPWSSPARDLHGIGGCRGLEYGVVGTWSSTWST